jgi:hypothetical protein
MNARVRIVTGEPGPGRLRDVQLAGARVQDGWLRLPGLAVLDVRGGVLDQADLCFDPADGGGPLATPREQTQARAFGVVNVAFHLQQGLQWAAQMLGRPLPPLVVRIGMHAAQRPDWAGGHYRLPADSYTSLPELESVAAAGEIHLGCGGSYLPFEGRRYFDAAAHNPAIVLHELGHHICRHTADFRLNERRPRERQANRKIPLDEGTSDYLAASLMDCADIFGWHRAGIPLAHPGRRCLNVARTMAQFRGGADEDPHFDGAVWAAALWSARRAVQSAGRAAASFDGLLLDGLRRIGASDAEVEHNEALRRRRHFSRALGALLAAAEQRDPALVGPITAAFSAHGIELGASNQALRDRSRARTLVSSAGGRQRCA